MFYKWNRGCTQIFWDIVGPDHQELRQRGLDQLLTRYLGQKTDGTFVEVGAFDGINGGIVTPLAEIGWSGIFVEASSRWAQECYRNFINHENVTVVHRAASNKTGEMVQLHGSGMGASIDQKYINVAKNIAWAGAMNPGELVETITIHDLLVEHNIEPGFDVLAVDVEGHEPTVFEDFDLKHWHPTLLCIEMTDDHPDFISFNDLNEKYRELRQKVLSNGYKEVYRDIINTVYVLE